MSVSKRISRLSGSFATVNLNAVNHNLSLIAFAGIQLQKFTEELNKFKMETAGKRLSKRDENYLDLLDGGLKKYKGFLEQVQTSAKLMEAA